ncbi:hypothetical protein A946_03225 [Methylacidiphilum kamchatkense Kam1]|uniref:LTXXQ motif family protein n=2 Tax=Methylacidiphilum kamchatkense TaxID=431057 RepID=A0A0C1V5N9_9BACT|nr:hypothetical protein [Methylacidiphilum kamchatkense]KIE59055.1 hypothetical protein A946_03225 [Methylacidiphilum kamchatkense Kam1]QDQ43039.1 hypothetical protein kam1_1825 [Methylacidiphilum kamchatkense Kam1]
MKMKKLKYLSCCFAFGSLLLSPVFAQNPPESQADPQAQSSSSENSHPHGKAYRHKMAREMHEKMQRLMDKQDEELKKLANEMNKAPKDQKLDKVVTLLNTLVNQRIQMHEEMKAMHHKMMGNHKEHHE